MVALFALTLTPGYQEAEMYAFENPADVSNSIIYFGLIIVFTAVVIVLSQKSELFLRIVMYSLVFISLYYVMLPFFGLFSAVFSLVMVILLAKKPNLFVINISAFLLSVGVTSIFGMSLEPFPLIVLLVILAVYDFISVYKTKHMVDLANSISEMKLPLLFILPKKLKCMSKEDYSVMGVGDVVIPNMLVVSSQVFTKSSYCFLFLKTTAIMTLLGGLVSLLILLILVERKPGAYPGLPFVNFGAIAGYLISQAI